MISFPYIIIILIISLLSFINHNKKTNKYLNLSAFIIYCFIAFRAPVVGADTYNYVRFFTGEQLYYNEDPRPLEPLFLTYNWLIHFFTHNSTLYLMINTLISLTPIYYIIKKYATNGALSILLFFIFEIYISYFVALRQILAISFLIWALIIVLENRRHCWIYFILISLIAYFIHTSAIVVSIVYLLSYFIKIKKRIYFIILIISSAIIGIFLENYSYLNVFSFISNHEFQFIDRISNYMNDYYTLEQQKYTYILRTSIIGLFVFLSIEKNKLNHWISKIYLSSIVFYNFFYAFPMLGRANLAFSLMSIIVFTWSLNKKYNIKCKYLINITALVIIILMSASFIKGCINPDLSSSSRMHPYYLFFEDYSDHPSIKKF